jgi:hypothetical protein
MIVLKLYNIVWLYNQNRLYLPPSGLERVYRFFRLFRSCNYHICKGSNTFIPINGPVLFFKSNKSEYIYDKWKQIISLLNNHEYFKSKTWLILTTSGHRKQNSQTFAS